MAHDVFISHSAKDKPVADAMCATLERAGLRCWIAPRDILPSQTWAAAIHAAVHGSRAFVLVFSAESNGSKQVLREVDQAVKAEVPILPFRIDASAAAPEIDYYVGSAHWLDALTAPLEAHLDRLARTLHDLLGSSPPRRRTAATASTSPFGASPEPAPSAVPAPPPGKGRGTLLALWLVTAVPVVLLTITGLRLAVDEHVDYLWLCVPALGIGVPWALAGLRLRARRETAVVAGWLFLAAGASWWAKAYPFVQKALRGDSASLWGVALLALPGGAWTWTGVRLLRRPARPARRPAVVSAVVALLVYAVFWTSVGYYTSVLAEVAYAWIPGVIVPALALLAASPVLPGILRDGSARERSHGPEDALPSPPCRDRCPTSAAAWSRPRGRGRSRRRS
jgi:hypothetical protein